ncbi:MAG TPA: hypothetical protein VJY62_22295, partial [Bacteroidia bacterium]|nr:hypothetical protein [Bacteroidia bacterium]
ILWFFLNKNPFDNSTYREYFSSRNILYNNIDTDAIIVWDSEYGKKQQGILLETLMQNNELKLLNINTPFASLGEKGVNTYVQYIFSKSKNAANSDNFRTEKNILGYQYTKMVKYSLKGFNQKYVSCDLGLNDSLLCNRDFNSNWEEFGFIFEDTKKLKILCANRKFITSTYDSSGFYLISKSETIEDGLLFEMLKIDSNHITLKTNNNNFLSVDSLSQKLFISANYKNSCQIFELVPVK